MLKILVNFAITCLSVIYPVFWFWQDESLPSLVLFYLLPPLWFLKGLLSQGMARYLALGLAFVLLLVALKGHTGGMFYYPLLVNGILLCLFGSSLFWQSQSFVERLARLQDPKLNEAGVCYTRRVTWVWTGFFAFNILLNSIVLWKQQYSFWALYNGVISYILLAIIMLSEWLIRQRIKRKITDV